MGDATFLVIRTGPDGTVANVRVDRPANDPRVDQAAMDAVRTMIRDGVRIPDPPDHARAMFLNAEFALRFRVDPRRP